MIVAAVADNKLWAFNQRNQPMSEQEIRAACSDLADAIVKQKLLTSSGAVSSIDFDPTPFLPILEAVLMKWNPALAPMIMRLVAMICGLVFKPKS